MAFLNGNDSTVVLDDMNGWSGAPALAPIGNSSFPVDEDGWKEFIDLRVSAGTQARLRPFSIRDPSGNVLEIRLQGAVCDYLLDHAEYPARGLRMLQIGAGYAPWASTFKEQIKRLSNVVGAIFANAGLVAPRSAGLLPCVLIGRGRVCFNPRRYMEKPPFEVISAGGLVDASGADVLKVGDLVDVTTQFDFFMNYGKDGLPRPCVFLVFVRIVRLKTRVDLAGQGKLGEFVPSGRRTRPDWLNRGGIGVTPYRAVWEGQDEDTEADRMVGSGSGASSVENESGTTSEEETETSGSPGSGSESDEGGSEAEVDDGEQD